MFFLIPCWNMPAALGHLGRCCASIGLRFTHAGTLPPRHRAPRTPPGTVGANRGTNRPHRIDLAGTRHALPPLAAAGASRGCCPAMLTLCVNRAALARALIYINLDVIGGTVAGGIRKTRPNHGARSGPHGLAMSCRFVAGSYPTASPCGCTRVAAV